MVGASLYIIGCSTRNLLRVRLRRLREPRYLLGSIAGAAYLYFVAISRMRGSRARAAAGRGRPTVAPAAALSSFQAIAPGLAGIALFALAAAAWLFPGRSGLLEFTQAEMALLFPAPLSPRQLLLHRLLRSQLGALFAALVMAIAFPSTSSADRVRFAVSMWLLFVTIRVYYAGLTLARLRLVSAADPAERRRAWTPILVVAGMVLIVGRALLGEFARQPATSAVDLIVRASRTATTGVAGIVLWPFVALVRPQFAPTLVQFVLTLGGSLIVFVAATAWMLAGDSAFDAAVSETAERRAAQAPARRSMPRQRSIGWTVALTGRPEGVFLWKNAMQMLRTLETQALRWAIPFVALSVGLSSAIVSANRLRGAAGFVCMFALAAAGFAIVFGPQVARSDLRGDLENLDLLKTWPVKSSAVIRGELLWPALVVTVFSWAAIFTAAIFSGTAFPRVPLSWRVAVALSAALAAPALVAAQFTVHNAVAVLFPAWVPTGRQRPRGIDAIGQRLILLAGIVISLVVMALPGALAGGIVWLATGRILGAAALVPAAVVFLAIVVVEVLVATEALAPGYERLDILSVERSE
jgi:hypothetical protein